MAEAVLEGCEILRGQSELLVLWEVRVVFVGLPHPLAGVRAVRVGDGDHHPAAECVRAEFFNTWDGCFLCAHNNKKIMCMVCAKMLEFLEYLAQTSKINCLRVVENGTCSKNFWNGKRKATTMSLLLLWDQLDGCEADVVGLRRIVIIIDGAGYL